MANRLPAELHIVSGTKSARGAKPLPETIRERVPKADWLDHFDLWDRDAFVAETSNFLWDTYGIGCNQDKHILAALAIQLDIYIKCCQFVEREGIVIEFNKGANVGPNPYLTAGDKALSRAIVLMNELGLTPKGRLATTKTKGGKYSKLLNGP
jgi:P27 family predicted phage terminase small subunit